MSSSIFLSTHDLKQAVVSVANNYSSEVRAQSLELQVKSTEAGEAETYLEIEMVLESYGPAEGLFDWAIKSFLRTLLNRRHVVCVALTEVSPRVLHFKIWPETIALGMFQRIAKVLLNLQLPDFIEISRDFSSVKIHLDKIFLPLPGEPSLVALPDLFHVQRFGFHSGSPGAVGVDFEIISSTPQ